MKPLLAASGAPAVPAGAWDWLLADGACPICGRQHWRWLLRLARRFGRSGA